MEPQRISFGIITDQLYNCREFYLQLGFEVMSDHDRYIQLRSPDGKYEIGFLSPEQMTQPPILKRPYSGRGCWINFEVADVDAAFQHAIDHSMIIELPIRDEPWGERHFIVRDPADMAINVMAKITKKAVSDFLP